MKKLCTIMLAMLGFASVASAGGLMTNTNYHIAFDRMFARGATTEIDAAYSNPAGLAWGHEGWQLSINFQKPWQNRDIKLTTPAGEKKFKGEASAPIVPALFASYKKDRWAVSTMIGIVGSGGYVEYKEGVPMFNALLGSTITSLTQQMNQSTQGFAPVVTPNQYDAEMKGKQYIYGGQVNFTYKFLDCLSAAVGIRANYYDGYYRGHVKANHSTIGNLASLSLDVDQKGWGFTPLIEDPLVQLVAAGALPATKAAEMAKAIKSKVESGLATYTAPYQDGAETRYDMPSLLSVAAGYEFTPKLRAALEYHFFDDKNAKMANDRQKTLSHGTHEILAGVEYDINKKFTISCGGQRTDYGITEEYQQNTSFACDSWSIGMGGAWNINEKMRLNASYFISIYSDNQKTTSYGIETYSRTNNVLGVGLDYKF